MNHIYILEADPTDFGGIQQFVRKLASYLPSDQVTLLAYYGALAKRKYVDCSLQILPPEQRCFSAFLNKAYRSGSTLWRNFALLYDIPVIRKQLEKRLDHDTLVVNSMFAMFFFCTEKVLQNNRIILVQHTCSRILRSSNYGFGGLFRKQKTDCFEKYVTTFVMLSPFEKKEFETWLPLKDKKCPVIRHAVTFPAQLPSVTPKTAAVLARFVTLKRIDRVIECAKQLPEITFNLYGSGPDEGRLKKLACGVNNVIFRGYTNNVDAVFQENSMLLITSEYEGYNIGGIEAVIHGRPVVVLNTYPAARDLVEDGVNGIVLEDFSAQILAEAVQKILKEYDCYHAGALVHRKLYDEDSTRQMWRNLLLQEGE